MLEMNKRSKGDQRLPGLAGGLRRGQGGGPHAQDRSSQSYYEHDYEGMMAVRRKNKKKLQVDPARRKEGEDLKAEVRGVDGQAAAVAGEDGRRMS